MSGSTTFLSVDDAALFPAAQAVQQDFMPSSVPADKLELNWIDYSDAIGSLFGGIKTNAGSEIPAPDGVTPNVDFQIGNGSTISRYAKEGHLITAYVRFTIGSTTIINNIVENPAGEHSGNMSVMIVQLPFPAAALQPYALATIFATGTVQASDNSLLHNSAFGTEIQALELTGGSRFVYIARDPLNYYWAADPKAPATYNSNGFRYYSVGDFFELQLEYETDYDG